MENSNDGSTGKVLGALLLGALAGAAVGILFAPYKGSKTRKRLNDGAKGVADDFKKKLNDEAQVLHQKAQALYDEYAKGKMDDMANTVK